jgi:hypothetical protein
MEAATSAAAARALARDFLENRPPIMDVLQRKAWADNGHLGEPGHNPDHERSQLTVLSGATRIPGTVRHRLPELSTKAKEELELERNYRLQQLAKLPVRPLSRTDSLPVTVSFLGSIVVAKGQSELKRQCEHSYRCTRYNYLPFQWFFVCSESNGSHVCTFRVVGIFQREKHRKERLRERTRN